MSKVSDKGHVRVASEWLYHKSSPQMYLKVSEPLKKVLVK